MSLNDRIAAIEKEEVGINQQISGVARTMGHVSVTHYGNLEGMQKTLSDELDTLAGNFFQGVQEAREKYEAGVRGENAEFERVTKALDLKLTGFQQKLADLDRQKGAIIWDLGKAVGKQPGNRADLKPNFNTRLDRSVAGAVERPGDGENGGMRSSARGVTRVRHLS